MLAITSAVAKWRHYLLGRHFTIITDHQSLKSMMTQTIQTPEQHKWLTKLLGYDYDIIYRSGSKNGATHALSRQEFLSISNISSPTFSYLEEFRKYWGTTTEGKEMATKAMEREGSPSFSNGLIYYKNRLFVPDTLELRNKVMQDFHSSPSAGHSGIKRTLAASFYWPNLKKSVEAFISSCKECQHVKYSTSQPLGLLQPLSIPELIWEEI